MKVCHSTTPQGEKHTDKELARQWNAIDWDNVSSDVNRLQTRIAKATQEGKWNLVKRQLSADTFLLRETSRGVDRHAE